MGSSAASRRMSIGLFYNKAYGMVRRMCLGKILFDFSYLFSFFKFTRNHFLACNSLVKSICNIETAILVWLLVLLSGDVELNPGPNTNSEHNISIMHCNIRSIRNKIEYVLNKFCDFDCLCFMETHLDNSLTDEKIYLTKNFEASYRKDRSSHGGGILEGIINHDLALITAWAILWLVDFNPIKTEALLFTLRPVEYMPSLNFNNTDITFVESHKHLGVTFTYNGQWHTHIDNILKSAYKTLGIMRKLKYTFSRQALNQMYISYVRPLVEYSSIVWDGCTEQDKNALEILQNEAARIVTGLTRSTTLANLYRECGWDSLANRRHFQKLCFMFKCTNNLIPDYITDIIPPLVRDVSNYPLRNRENVSNMYTRTEISHKSCIPSSISYWNNLQTNIREADTYESFRHSLKRDIFDNINVPIYFSKGNRKLSILHARIRNNCSDLNSDLFLNHLINDRSCSCGNDNENARHYFFECDKYSYLRILMFRKTRQFHPLSLNTILYGKSNVSNDENFLLFQAVQQYIKDSRRFN